MSDVYRQRTAVVRAHDSGSKYRPVSVRCSKYRALMERGTTADRVEARRIGNIWFRARLGRTDPLKL